MPWATIASFLLKLFMWMIDKDGENKELQRAYLNFVSVIEHQGLASVSLNESDRAQVEELKERRDKLNSKSGTN